MTDYFLIPGRRFKYAADIKPFTVDWKGWLRSYWIAGRRYNSGDYVRSPSVPGFAYQASGGEAGAVEPAWPRTLAGTVTDGSITWTAAAPGNNAVDTISSVAWSQVSPPDSALVIGSTSNTTEEAVASFSAGAQGQTYRIQCEITTAAGYSYGVQFDLEIGS